ncbi:hypothetical protein CALVIDRAFT_534954 [Calocera viscosa TUFC12733]|uniref:Uncharacterized protein n=1 Tax=Calocera viscosa (strain TUFC12733) TaxID=1330018 RepID=A0A167PJR2_CALVF|nr:hypothetical protein CALVIDRAFT_534954 [Calocera viscosa TUFC12733]
MLALSQNAQNAAPEWIILPNSEYPSNFHCDLAESRHSYRIHLERSWPRENNSVVRDRLNTMRAQQADVDMEEAKEVDRATAAAQVAGNVSSLPSGSSWPQPFLSTTEYDMKVSASRSRRESGSIAYSTTGSDTLTSSTVSSGTSSPLALSKTLFSEQDPSRLHNLGALQGVSTSPSKHHLHAQTLGSPARSEKVPPLTNDGAVVLSTSQSATGVQPIATAYRWSNVRGK